MKLSLLALTLLATPALAHPRGEQFHFDRPARADQAQVRAERPAAERARATHEAPPAARTDQPAAHNDRAPGKVNTCKKGECTGASSHADHSDEK